MGISCSSDVRLHQRRGQHSRRCGEPQLQLPQRRDPSDSSSIMSSTDPSSNLERLYLTRGRDRLSQSSSFITPPPQSGWNVYRDYCASIGSSPIEVSPSVSPGRLAFGFAMFLRDRGLKGNTISQYISHVQKIIDLRFAFCEDKTPFRSTHLATLVPLAHN